MLELVAALTKFLLYAGCLSAAGLALAEPSLGRSLGEARSVVPRTVFSAALLGLVGCLANVAVLVFRLGGEFSADMFAAIAETSVGPAAVMQVGGAVSLMAAAWIKGPGMIVRALAAIMILASFGVNGHAPSQGLSWGGLAFVHVALAAWWIGALLLLQAGCLRLAPESLAQLVRRFSHIAMGAVGVLAIAGSVLVVLLVDLSLIDAPTSYVQALALKIVLALLLIGVAVRNKLQITPRLVNDDGSRILHNAIGLELGVIAGVMMATAWLTTFNSPFM